MFTSIATMAEIGLSKHHVIDTVCLSEIKNTIRYRIVVIGSAPVYAAITLLRTDEIPAFKVSDWNTISPDANTGNGIK